MNSENMNCILTYAKDPAYKEVKLSTLDQIFKNGSGLPMKKDIVEGLDDICEKLKNRLVECEFPLEIDDYKIMGGHPSVFMKIIHHLLFEYNVKVKNLIFSKGIDPQVVELSDWKFIERVMFILPNIFGIKPKISIL